MFVVGSKVLLVLFLARELPLADLGIYGLVVATTTLATSLVGFELHTFALRELVKREPADRPDVVWSQVRFYAVAYAVAAPVLAGFVVLGPLPLASAAWFVPVLVGTHASIEIHRLLIAVSRPLAAYVVLASAHGLWVVPVIGVGLVAPDELSLHVVFACWTAFSWLTVIASIPYLRGLGLLAGGPGRARWDVVRAGLRVSWVFLLVALAQRAIDTTDRYFVQAYAGEAQVGVYTFFSRAAGVLFDVVYSGVTVAIVPALVAAYQERDAPAWQQHVRRLLRASIGVTLALVPVVVGATLLALAYIDSPAMDAGWTCFAVLLAAFALTNISVVAQYVLYCRGADRAILAIATVTVVVNLAANAILVPRWGIEGAAGALLAAYVAQAAARVYLWRRGDGEPR
jgi:O-antigen/teichoic acid export membrane protein